MIIPGGHRVLRHLRQELASDPYRIRAVPIGTIDTFIDLGANCGLVSMLFRFVHPTARVIAVEPNPIAYQAMVQNVSNLNIEGYNLALGDGRPVSLVGGNHILGQQYDVVPGAPETFESLRFSDMLLRFKVKGHVFLKVDVEGSEHYLMDDSESDALRSCDILSMEIHADRGFDRERYAQWLRTTFAQSHSVARLGNSRRGWMLYVRRFSLDQGA